MYTPVTNPANAKRLTSQYTFPRTVRYDMTSAIPQSPACRDPARDRRLRRQDYRTMQGRHGQVEDGYLHIPYFPVTYGVLRSTTHSFL
jgi:hypothetical protein